MNNYKLQEGFGERLKLERKRLSLSQAQFAEKVGLKRITQHMYEKEQNYPNYRYFRDISDLGVDLSYLFFNKKADTQRLELSLSTLKDIFSIVDDKCRDESGNPLTFEKRVEFFILLCVSISGRSEETFEIDNIVTLLSR